MRVMHFRRGLALCMIVATACTWAFSQPRLVVRPGGKLYGVFDFRQPDVRLDEAMWDQPEFGVMIDHSLMDGRKAEFPRVPRFRLKVREANERLATYGSLAAVFQATEQAGPAIELLLRDVAPADQERFLEMAAAARRQGKDDGFSFWVLPPGAEGEVRRFAPKSEEELVGLWRKEVPAEERVRFVAYDGFCAVSVGKRSGEREIREVLDAKLPELTRLGAQAATVGNPMKLAAAVQGVTDDIFSKLTVDGLMNDDLRRAQLRWDAFAASDPGAQDWRSHAPGEIILVSHSLHNAAGQPRCLVVVGSTKGRGADIQYALPVDARADNFKQFGSQTMAWESLERNTYVFRLLRNKKETARTSPIDCHDVAVPIQIDEP